LPADVIKGIKITISEIKAAQVFGTLIVKTESGIKLSVEVWKNGKYVRTLNIEGDHEEKGVNRSAEPVSTLLQKNLQNLMQKLVPDIIKTMEES
jgi:riboflavin synthase alpha subunit